MTDDAGERRELLLADVPPDLGVVAQARDIASRLALKRPRREATRRAATGKAVSVAYRETSDELDLERTLEVLVEHGDFRDEPPIVRERYRPAWAVVLLVDISGSMRGERIRTAAATVGALASGLQPGQLSVIAFWSDAAHLLRLGEPGDPLQAFETLLRIPARGLTNVALPLQQANNELAHAFKGGRVVLLSDCVHNCGPDPRPIAAGLPRLDVLVDVSGEHDAELAYELASLGRGQRFGIRTFRDVAPAVTTVFSREPA